MAKENQVEEQETRKYTMALKDGREVVKKREELTGEVVHACERLHALNIEIGRLNSALLDSTALQAHYNSIALPSFEEKEDDPGDSAES